MFGCAVWKLILRESYVEDIIPVFCSYTSSIFAAQTKLRRQLPIFLPLVALFCKDIRESRVHLRRATQLLSPAFRRARDKLETRIDQDDGPIDWILHNAGKNQVNDDEYLTNLLLAYGIAFVFAASPTGAQLITEAAFRSGFCDAIREEALRIDHLEFNKSSLQSLTILDSFCKETHKHHPTAACMVSP